MTAPSYQGEQFANCHFFKLSSPLGSIWRLFMQVLIGTTVRSMNGFASRLNASTINVMRVTLIWDESKRQSNLRKHGLDFADANEVLESRYRLDISVVRSGEPRMLSISYALGFLAVLTVVHTERERATRVISFRHASNAEREVYDAWLQDE